jgi:hypothetical protein
MITVKKTLFAAVAVALAGFVAHAAIGATNANIGHSHGNCSACPRGCGHFQCDCQCNTVCQPTIEMKKIEEVCWECECKTVCLAGPSCGCKGTCGLSRQVKRLIRKTVTREVPVVKCNAVEGAACGCGAGEPAVVPGTMAPEAPMPAAPMPPASASGSPFSIDNYTLQNPAAGVILSSSRRTTTR